MRNILKGWHIVVLVAGVLISLGLWQYGKTNDQTNQKDLEQDSVYLAKNLEQYIEHLEDYSDAVAALYEASDKVEDDELSSFVQKVFEPNEYPEILRISFIEKVGTEDISTWEKEYERVNGKTIKVEIDPESKEQFLVSSVVNTSGKRYIPSGKNHLLDPERRKIVENLRANKEVAIRYLSPLVNIDEYSGDGFVLAVPCNKNEEMLGFVYLVLSGEGLRAKMNDELQVGRMEKWQTGETTIFEGTMPKTDQEIQTVAKVKLPDETVWDFVIIAANPVAKYWQVMLVAMLLTSIMISFVIYVVGTTGRKAQAMADEMTQEMRKYKLALDSSSNHIVLTDTDGVIVYANKAAQVMTGFDKEEMRGQTPRLWGRQMSREFYEELWKTIKNQKKVFIGEIRNKRKNGEIYEAYANISPIISDEGKLVGFVGVEQDITDKNKLITELTSRNKELAKLMDLTVERETRIRQLKEELEKKG